MSIEEYDYEISDPQDDSCEKEIAIEEALIKHDEKLQQLTAPNPAMEKLNLSTRLLEVNPAIQKLSEQTSRLASIRDTAELLSVSPTIRAALEPIPELKAIQESMKSIYASSAAWDALKESYQWRSQITTSISPVLKAFAEFNRSKAELFSSALVKVVGNYTAELSKAINPPIMGWLKTAISSPIIEALQELKSLIPKNFNQDRFNELYLGEMKDARWFPYVGWNADLSLATEILNIIDSTRKSKNRVKQIDRAIFAYYNKQEIELVRKSWRELGLTTAKLRIFNQAVYAYHRGEYALTVSTLVALWEGIIAEKTNAPDDYRVSRKTRQNLTKLIEENDYDEIFSSFCEEFIFYDCTKPEEVKADVPGRHGIAHSWYEKYPNRKVALNAILFTDFLLKLEPIN